ncbi:hypothetical protein [Xanthomonas euvesicatoria]|uniref:hypothetical protein n=1 Tax=Xanthomonas TaxID=338 RepID=UPI002456E79F|nr:hypothetical protein [Xanthomonas euvesicatoria]MDH4908087.1 hypothetical protein [Xanthomonas euvesicatoria]
MAAPLLGRLGAQGQSPASVSQSTNVLSCDFAEVPLSLLAAQPAFWDPFAARCNQIAARQSPARPVAGQFYMVRDLAPM